MSSTDTMRLWRLAQLDNRLADVRSRAAGLDVGQKLAAEVKALEAKVAETDGAAHALRGESSDLELANGTIAEKIKRIDKELYGGKVVSSREIEGLQKEIAAQKKQSERNDERILELMESIPPAEETAAKWKRALDQRRQMLAKRQAEARVERTALETEYKDLATRRPELAKIVPPSLLTRYESIRQKHGGIGMVEVNIKDTSCTGCGTHLPERTIQGLKDGKALSCETCHRLLYYTEGAI